MAPPALDLAVLAASTVRATRLATTDDMPWLAKARRRTSDWLGHRVGLEWADLPYCPHCASVWCAAAVTAAYVAAGARRDRVVLALLPLALSAVAGWAAEHEAH